MRAGDTGVKKVTVGIVLKPVGLKGELKVMPLTDNPDRFAEGAAVWLDSEEGAAEFTVVHVGEHKRNLRVRLSGIDTAEQAEKYRDREIYVPESEVPPLPEGVYYHYQIIGLDVYYYDSRLLGQVKEIFTAGEKDVYVVRGKGREYLIPVTEDTVREIDLKAGRILVNRMEGYIQ